MCGVHMRVIIVSLSVSIHGDLGIFNAPFVVVTPNTNDLRIIIGGLTFAFYLPSLRAPCWIDKIEEMVQGSEQAGRLLHAFGAKI